MENPVDPISKLIIPEHVKVTALPGSKSAYEITTPTGSCQLQILNLRSSKLIAGLTQWKINAFEAPDVGESFKQYFGKYQYRHMWMTKRGIELLLETQKVESNT